MRNKIVILPLGEIDFVLINKLASSLASCFSLGVEILQAVQIPPEAYNEKRGQYYSTVILNKLELLKSDDKERILGLLDEDLYIPTLNFVFGEADPDSKVAVISIYRLKQEYYGLPEDELLFFERVYKEAIHELGHTMKLVHCTNPRCVMYFSQTMLDTDRKSKKMCDNCQRKLQI